MIIQRPLQIKMGFKQATHRAGGGDVKIENRKLDWKAESKVDKIIELPMYHFATGSTIIVSSASLQNVCEGSFYFW